MAGRMRIVISNFSPELPSQQDFRVLWRRAQCPPPPRRRHRLFEQPADWGFHLYSIGVYLMDQGVAERVEFWDYSPERSISYHSNGVLRVMFHNSDDVAAYLARFGPPDLFINHGVNGVPILPLLAGTTFRVHVPTLRTRDDPLPGAECFLLDAEDQLIDRSMVYIPVVNTEKIRPKTAPGERDFIYLAACYEGKRHDLLVNAVRGTELTGHLHPVRASQVDLSDTHITTSDLDERDVVELLQTSRIAVYPGDWTSNPAAMWECVAAGLPIVVNAAIAGGKHLVVPGITGELTAEDEFLDAMRSVLAKRDQYSPREYFEANWDTVTWIERYLAFFVEMGWNP
jgi:Glycosyl transferases group 1